MKPKTYRRNRTPDVKSMPRKKHEHEHSIVRMYGSRVRYGCECGHFDPWERTTGYVLNREPLDQLVEPGPAVTPLKVGSKRFRRVLRGPRAVTAALADGRLTETQIKSWVSQEVHRHIQELSTGHSTLIVDDVKSSLQVLLQLQGIVYTSASLKTNFAPTLQHLEYVKQEIEAGCEKVTREQQQTREDFKQHLESYIKSYLKMLAEKHGLKYTSKTTKLQLVDMILKKEFGD